MTFSKQPPYKGTHFWGYPGAPACYLLYRIGFSAAEGAASGLGERKLVYTGASSAQVVCMFAYQKAIASILGGE